MKTKIIQEVFYLILLFPFTQFVNTFELDLFQIHFSNKSLKKQCKIVGSPKSSK